MHTRRFTVLLTTVATLMSLGVAAMAQDSDQNQDQNPRFPRLRNRLLQLLQTEQVRKHLNVDEQQQAAVQKITQQASKDRPPRRQNPSDQTDEQRQKMQAQAQQRFQGVKQKLAGVLSEKQMGRLSQLHVQSRGLAAMEDDPAIAAQLKLTEEQQVKIAQIQQENRTNMRAAFRELRGSDDRQAAVKKLADLRQQGEKALLAVLTQEQLAQLEQMKGEKFDLPPQGRFGGRGRAAQPAEE